MLQPMDRPDICHWSRKAGLAAECGALFLGVPTVCALGWLPLPIIPLLLVMAGGCWLALQRLRNARPRKPLFTNPARREWKRILFTYAVAIPLLLGLLWLMQPEAMFSLLKNHAAIWLLVMVAYPIVSVVPQEIIYRAFLFERYQSLFGRRWGMNAVSAALFSFGHIVFHNWPAVLLAFFGGWLFAVTYRRTGSLLAVSIEHALYGCAIFTIGFGQYFLAGTLKFIGAN